MAKMCKFTHIIEIGSIKSKFGKYTMQTILLTSGVKDLADSL